jgi:hypothetical protein
MSGRPQATLVLTDTERQELKALALRARIVQARADEHDNKVVAERQRITPQMVSKWRARFVAQRRMACWTRHALAHQEQLTTPASMQ